MGPNRSDRILQEWSAIARSATTPEQPRRRATVRGAGAGAGVNLIGAAALALVVVVAIAWLGNREGLTGPGSIPSATPPATVPPASTAEPSPTDTASPVPSPTPELTVCESGALVPRITMWEGAAGHRIAHVQLTNMADAACVVSTVTRVQLVDGDGDVLIDGDAPTGSSNVTIPARGVVTALVQAGNYCGPAPVAPVSLAFWFSGGFPTLALPSSPTDTDVPPCNGPGSPGTIDMQPWRP